MPHTRTPMLFLRLGCFLVNLLCTKFLLLHKEAQIFKNGCYLGFQNFSGMSESIQNRFEEIREMINKSKTLVFLLIFNFLVLLIASCIFFNLWSLIFQQHTLYHNKLTFWHENKTHTQGFAWHINNYRKLYFLNIHLKTVQSQWRI